MQFGSNPALHGFRSTWPGNILTKTATYSHHHDPGESEPVTNLVTIPLFWLIIGGVLCTMFGYSVGRDSGKVHTINQLTQHYRRGLEQAVKNPQNRNRGKKK